jgi:hypothetical protein
VPLGCQFLHYRAMRVEIYTLASCVSLSVAAERGICGDPSVSPRAQWTSEMSARCAAIENPMPKSCALNNGTPSHRMDLSDAAKTFMVWRFRAVGFVDVPTEPSAVPKCLLGDMLAAFGYSARRARTVADGPRSS